MGEQNIHVQTLLSLKKKENRKVEIFDDLEEP
jgi:hypothetical protein